MKIKKIFVSITFMLAILPATVYAQESMFTSMYELPSGSQAIGIGYETIDNFHNIAVSVERGLAERLKGSVVTVVRFSEDDFLTFLLSELFTLMYTDSLGSTDFAYYIIGAIGGTYLYVGETEARVSRYYYGTPKYEYVTTFSSGVHSLDVIGGGGLIAPLGQIKPFVGYAFRYRRTLNVGSTNSQTFSGGVEYDISKKISLIGRANWPFSSRGFRNPTLEISINFH